MAPDLSTAELPAVDAYVQRVDASPERVWSALVATLGTMSAKGPPRPIAAAWGLAITSRRGDWSTDVAVGDSLPGFAVVESEPGRRLVLRGAHRFSQYELRFELEPAGDHVDVHAITCAAFPGVKGWFYRAAVIGSGGHTIVVRRFLKRLATQASAARGHGAVDSPRSTG